MCFQKDFQISKTLVTFLSHLSSSFFFSMVKKWKTLSNTYDRKKYRVAICFVNCRTSFIVVRSLMLMISWHLFGLILIPLLVSQHEALKLPYLDPKISLGHVYVHDIPHNISQDFFQILTIVLLVLHIYYHAIYVYLYVLTYLFCKDCVN